MGLSKGSQGQEKAVKGSQEQRNAEFSRHNDKLWCPSVGAGFATMPVKCVYMVKRCPPCD
jgi:hypothetical protein